jgi:aminoglycoside phosphotransferase (APT) family kinase protein
MAISARSDPAADDLVATHEQAKANARPPLLVIEPLKSFLSERGLGRGELTAQEIGEGHSCVTLRVLHGERRLILRRPPRPPVPPSTHDVLREARVLTALRGSPVPVPEVLAVCTEDSVIGAPFYMMEEVAGFVPTSDLPPDLDEPRSRHEIALRIVELLHRLQQVDWRAVGLERFGRPSGYLERQLRRFTELWEVNRTREIPAVSKIGAWLAANMPESPPATIVHGDFRLGNAMYDVHPPVRINAMLDWEMSTIGDPLSDLGLLAIRWTEANDPPHPLELGPVTRLPGFPTRRELVEMYSEVSGRTTRHIGWYATLALWKSIVFMEGNYKRAMIGASDDPFLKSFGDGVLELTALAENVGPGGKGID